MKVTNLSSGSKGNCTFVCTDKTKVLIDIGINYKLLSQSLAEIGEKPENIDAILITHEHSDHIAGLECFANKNKDVHIFAHNLVKEEILKKSPALSQNVFITFEYGNNFSVGDFSVHPMENFHDSKSCASFILSAGGGALGVCTDLGIITDNQVDMLSRCKVVYIECNHDINMLANCRYPKILKTRISGKFGHLSNDQCATACVKFAQNQTKVIVLSHISENSNTPEIAYSRVAEELELANQKNVLLLLAYQNKVGKTITIN